MIIKYDHMWSSYMTIIYDTGNHMMWASHLMIIHDHHTWWSCMTLIYGSYMGIRYEDRIWSHIWSPYVMIIYDDHIWVSYLVIIYGDHIWSSYIYIYMIIIYICLYIYIKAFIYICRLAKSFCFVGCVHRPHAVAMVTGCAQPQPGGTAKGFSSHGLPDASSPSS